MRSISRAAEKPCLTQSAVSNRIAALEDELGAIKRVLHTRLIPMVNTPKCPSPRINFELTIETTQNLVEQIRRGALDIAFSAQPAQEEGLVSETPAPLEMVFVGARTMAAATFELDALPFVPLPLHAIYWNYPMDPTLKQAIRNVETPARAYTTNEDLLDEAPFKSAEAAQAASAAGF